MNLTGTMAKIGTGTKLKLPTEKLGPISIDPGNRPDIPGIPKEYGWMTTMACGEEGNPCEGIDEFDSREVGSMDSGGDIL
jgi:hypothetical protein